MCGIVGLHLRDPDQHPALGRLLAGMLGEVAERGPDSAGVAVYGDHRRHPAGHAVVSLLDAPDDLVVAGASVTRVGATTIVAGAGAPDALAAAALAAAPDAVVVGSGTDLAVYKGTGDPR